MFFDLRSKISEKPDIPFTQVSEPTADPGPSTSRARSKLPPPPDENLNAYLLSGPRTDEESREKQEWFVKQKEKILITKSVDPIKPADQVFFTRTERRRFGGRYGDRSGINVWGYTAPRKLWFIKRKSGNIEYYKQKRDLLYMTKVGLTELANAPFSNPSKNESAKYFRSFLKRQSKNGFKDVRTATTIRRTVSELYNPVTKRNWVKVLWPPTRRLKKVPLGDRFRKGILKDLEFWTLNSEDCSVTVKTADDSFTFFDKTEFLRFSEYDIKKLASSQIISEESFEIVAKEYTSFVANIVADRRWAGELDQKTDAELLEM